MGWWDGAQCSSAACIEADYYNLILDKGEEAWNCLFGVETGGPFASVTRVTADETEICADDINLIRGYIEQMTDVECPECDWPELEDPCPDSRDVVGRSDPGDPDVVCICDYFCLEEALDCIVENCCGSFSCPSEFPDPALSTCNACDPGIPKVLCLSTFGYGDWTLIGGSTFCIWGRIVPIPPASHSSSYETIRLTWSASNNRWELQVIWSPDLFTYKVIDWVKNGSPCDPTGTYTPVSGTTFAASVSYGPLYYCFYPEHATIRFDEERWYCEIEDGRWCLGFPNQIDVTLPDDLPGMFAPWSGGTYTVTRWQPAVWSGFMVWYVDVPGGEYGATVVLAEADYRSNRRDYAWRIALIVKGSCGEWRWGVPTVRDVKWDPTLIQNNKGVLYWDYGYVGDDPFQNRLWCDPLGSESSWGYPFDECVVLGESSCSGVVEYPPSIDDVILSTH